MNQATKSLTTRDGIALAIQLLRELKAQSSDECGLDPEFRNGQPQRNAVLQYLDSIDAYASGSPALKEGFASVLTDFIATCLNGGVTDAEFYERFLEPAKA